MHGVQKFILEIVEIIKDFGEKKTFLALKKVSPGLFRFANVGKPSALTERKGFADTAPWIGPLYSSLSRAPEAVASATPARAGTGDTRLAGLLPDWIPGVGGDDNKDSDVEQEVFISGQYEPIKVDNQDLEDLIAQTNELLANLNDDLVASLAQIDLSIDDLISANTGATLADVTGRQAQQIGHPARVEKEPEKEEPESKEPEDKKSEKPRPSR